MRCAPVFLALLALALGRPLPAAEEPAETETSPTEEEGVASDEAYLIAARAANVLYQQRLFLLRGMLEHEEEAKRLHAMRQLARLDDPTVIPDLLPFLQHDLHSKAEVTAAIMALSHLGSEQAANKLRELAALEDDELRTAAVYGLHMMDVMGVDDYKLQLPVHRQAVKTSSVVMVGELEAQEAGETLVEILDHDPRNFVRQRAAIALGRLGMREFGPALATALTDPDPKVRRRAAQALAVLDYKPGIPKLLMALDANIASLGLYRSLVSLVGMEAAKEIDFSPYAGRFDRKQAIDRAFNWWTAHKDELTP